MNSGMFTLMTLNRLGARGCASVLLLASVTTVCLHTAPQIGVKPHSVLTETSAVVATRSVLLPPVPQLDISGDAMDILPLEVPPQKENHYQPINWELWEEESTIEVCELSIDLFQGTSLSRLSCT